MKIIFSVMICVLLVAVCGGACNATLHPVEGSTNFLVTDDEPENTNCADIWFVFARGSGAPHLSSAE